MIAPITGFAQNSNAQLFRPIPNDDERLAIVTLQSIAGIAEYALASAYLGALRP